MSVLTLCVHAWYLRRPEEGAGSPGTGVSLWTLAVEPRVLQEQSAPLATGVSPKPNDD